MKKGSCVCLVNFDLERN